MYLPDSTPQKNHKIKSAELNLCPACFQERERLKEEKKMEKKLLREKKLVRNVMVIS